jgi:hypothetical protein
MEQNMHKHHQSSPCTAPEGTGRSRPTRQLRWIGIVVGDLFFLALVGAVSMAAMHMAHMTEWGFAVEVAIGMVVAMIVQIVLAWLAAPLLGSIETMVPSMLVAMIAPMAICLLHGSGCVLTSSGALLIGAASGVLASSLLAVYGASCRRWALTARGNTLGKAHP